MSPVVESEIQTESGFTLLEVMIALAIMFISFASILMVESSSLRSATRSKELNVATMLLKQQMIETELTIEGKTFTEIDKEKTGEFKEPFQNYRWKREVKEVKFPNFTGISSDSASEGGNMAAGDAAQKTGRLITSYLSKAVREVVVTITWTAGKGERNVDAATYWVNFNQEFSLNE